MYDLTLIILLCAWIPQESSGDNSKKNEYFVSDDLLMGKELGVITSKSNAECTIQ